MCRVVLFGFLLLFGWVPCSQSAPDATMSVTPIAVSGETVSASDENSRNNEISTKYNSHTHTDISSESTNTFTIGDNAVGNKTYAVDTDQASNPGLRYNTTNDLWTVSQDGSTYLAVAHVDVAAGLASGAMVYSAGTTSGAITSAGRASNGQVLIGRTGGDPILGNITGSTGITVTNGAGTIDISGAGLGTPSLTLSTSNSAGSATTAIRTDATIAAFDATNPADLGTAAPGTATVAARRDHVHSLGSVEIFSNMQVFTTSGTWTRPAGVDRVYVECWGGAGGGGESGGGGAGGAGGAGGQSSFGTAVVANGGSGGGGGAAGTDGAGGAAGGAAASGTGTFQIRNTGYAGGPGGAGGNDHGGTGGNGGSAARGGGGGAGGLPGVAAGVGAVGAAGIQPGGGGGGGGGSSAAGGGYDGGGGGAPGGYAAGIATVTGDVTVTVGAGGAGGTGDATGVDGAAGAAGGVVVYWNQ